MSKNIRTLGFWEYTDGNKTKLRVEVKLDEGDRLEKIVRHLAYRARQSPRKRATALGGALVLTVIEDTEAGDRRLPGGAGEQT